MKGIRTRYRPMDMVRMRTMLHIITGMATPAIKVMAIFWKVIFTWERIISRNSRAMKATSPSRPQWKQAPK